MSLEGWSVGEIGHIDDMWGPETQARIDEALREWPADVDRIVSAFRASGMEISRARAAWFWLERSDAWSAGWMLLPAKDHMIVDQVRRQAPHVFEGQRR